MKYLLTVALAFATLLNAQDGELPGWGVYVGGGLGSASFEDSAVEPGAELALPFIGVSKGLMLGVPLLINVGLGKRAFNQHLDFGGYEMDYTYVWDYLDIGIATPLAVGPGVAQVGALYGLPMGGKATIDMDGNETEVDVEADDMDADYGLMVAYSYPVTESISVNTGYYIGLFDHGDGGPTFNGLFALLSYNF